MAVAIPLLMMAGGATATTALVVGVAFAVTGINDKINKAASGVFGEDLVKVANIAGMAYGAYQAGAFDGLSSAGAEMGVQTASQAAAGADSFAQSMSSYAVDPTAITSTGLPNYAMMPDPAAIGSNGLPNYAMMPDPTSAATGTSSLADGMQGTKMLGTSAPADYALGAPKTTMSGMGSTPAQAAPTTLPSTAVAPPVTTGAAAPVASDYSLKANYSLASEPTASANQFANDALTLKGGTGGTGATSFFDKLVTGAGKAGSKLADSPYVMAGLAQGVAGGYSAAQTRAIEQAKLDYQRQVANIGSAGWVQTQ